MPLLDDRILRKLDAFVLAMREQARGETGGLRSSRAMGSSVEFSDFRVYAPGDDLRRVDWNAYARFDKLFLKLFLDEQETTLRVLLDASASMRHGQPDKWELAIRIAAALSYLALTRYDRVMVAIMKGETTQVSRRFSGRRTFPEVEAFLTDIAPSGETRLNEALERVPITAGRGVCVLLSDLLTGEGWTRGVSSLLYKRQELSVLHILSPQELHPDMTGAVRLLDAEGGPTCDVQLSSDALKRYQETLKSFLQEQRRFCHGRDFPYLLLNTEMDFERDALKTLTQGGLLAAR